MLLCFLELCPTQRSKKLRKKGEKNRLRVSSSEDSEESDAIVELTVSEFQRIMNRIAKIEEAKRREARIAKLETELILAKEEAEKVKYTSQQLENSLQFTQKEQEEVLERITHTGRNDRFNVP